LGNAPVPLRLMGGVRKWREALEGGGGKNGEGPPPRVFTKKKKPLQKGAAVRVGTPKGVGISQIKVGVGGGPLLGCAPSCLLDWGKKVPQSTRIKGRKKENGGRVSGGFSPGRREKNGEAPLLKKKTRKRQKIFQNSTFDQNF